MDGVEADERGSRPGPMVPGRIRSLEAACRPGRPPPGRPSMTMPDRVQLLEMPVDHVGMRAESEEAIPMLRRVHWLALARVALGLLHRVGDQVFGELHPCTFERMQARHLLSESDESRALRPR